MSDESIDEGGRFNAEHLVQLWTRRGVLQENLLFREDVLGGAEGCQSTFMEAGKNEFLLARVCVDVTHSEDARDGAFELFRIHHNLLAFEFQTPFGDRTDLGLKTDDQAACGERHRHRP